MLQTGKLLQYLPENNVYVYFRYNQDQRVMVVINNDPSAQELDLDRFSEGLKGSTSGRNILSGENISLGEKLAVEGKTSLVIEL